MYYIQNLLKEHTHHRDQVQKTRADDHEEIDNRNNGLSHVNV